MSYRRRQRGVLTAMLLAIAVSGMGSLAGPVAGASQTRFHPGPFFDLAWRLADFVPGLSHLAQALVGPSSIGRGSDNRLTVLLVGSDHRDGDGTGDRLDSILVLTINHHTKNIAALSIPRDTGFIPLAEGGTFNGKINGLFKYYKKRAGGDRAVAMNRFERTIEHTLAIQIDYHAFIRFDGFDALVDEVDGVPTAIPKEIRDTGYIDKPGWPKGAKFLATSSTVLRGGSAARCYGPYPQGQWDTAPNCARALVFVRSRKGKVGSTANNDWKRSQRQQDFIFQAIRRVTSRTATQAQQLRNRANAIPSDFYTNLPRVDADVLFVYNLLRGSDLTQQVVLMPSTYATRVQGTSKYRLNLAEVRKLTKNWFGPL
jgi:anionic cell wall polymer biosynthesis LytR-Cps2A-Psr (LCP) family protein